MKKLVSYENGIVTLMALTFGILFFDRLALNFLMPFVSVELGLNNSQIGMLAGGLSLAWAFSAYFTTSWSETNNKNKLVFLGAIVLFSICSIGSGLATSFATLLLARVIMGIAEGPVIPLAQTFVERESTPSRLGLNVGILQAVGSALMGSIIAPVLLVQIADDMGWRTAFYIAGVPGLILGMIAGYYLKPSTVQSKTSETKTTFSFRELWAYHNIRWGIFAACCTFGWWFALLPFIANYFVNVHGMSADRMGMTMGLLGVAGLLSSVVIPATSDKIGRKKALMIALSLGIFFAFAVYFLRGSALLIPAIFISYFTMGGIPLVAAIIPSEAVPEHLKGKAIGLVTGAAEIFGGVLIPGVAGGLSDAVAPSAFLWVSSGMAILGLLCVSQLKSNPITVEKTN